MTKLAQVGILSAVLAGAWIVPAFTQSANRSGPPSTVIQPKAERPSGSADQTVQHCRDHSRMVTAQMDGLDRAVARLDARMIRQRFGRPWMQPRRRPQPQERTLISACG